MQGTKFLSRSEARERFAATNDLNSLQGSTELANRFNLKYQVYSESQAIEDYMSAVLYEGQ
jgi:hypothetical protein